MKKREYLRKQDLEAFKSQGHLWKSISLSGTVLLWTFPPVGISLLVAVDTWLVLRRAIASCVFLLPSGPVSAVSSPPVMLHPWGLIPTWSPGCHQCSSLVGKAITESCPWLAFSHPPCLRAKVSYQSQVYTNTNRRVHQGLQQLHTEYVHPGDSQHSGSGSTDDMSSFFMVTNKRGKQ